MSFTTLGLDHILYILQGICLIDLNRSECLNLPLKPIVIILKNFLFPSFLFLFSFSVLTKLLEGTHGLDFMKFKIFDQDKTICEDKDLSSKFSLTVCKNFFSLTDSGTFFCCIFIA